ncbi:MAG TPA: M81 family metallopeptidase [Planctomycetota bacterium]|nr:M81 family metallopeptidase [Planctomycetota bacterium]
MRILTAAIAHETNTFIQPRTTLEDFRRASPTGELVSGAPILEHFHGTRTIHGGFIDEAARQGLTVEPLLWTFPVPGGTVEQVAYDFLKNLLLERLRAAGPCDGVLLDLHGAMVTSGLEDAEGDLAEAVRGVVGPRVPIIMTLDLHASLTGQMVRCSDLVIGFDRYPHTDMYERGVEAAQAFGAIGRGQLRPTMAFRMLPLVSMPVSQCTSREPMRSLLARAHAMEQEPGVVNVTLISGFAMADIHDAGMSVAVTTNSDPELAQRKADEMARAIWDRRDDFTPRLTPIPDALAYARQARGLVMLADGSDNPGAGGACDTTEILHALLADQFPDAVVNCIHDPATVAQACQAGVGATISARVGGKADPRYGAPVPMQARVKLISDGEYIRRGPMGGGEKASFGRTAVLVQGGVQVIVSSLREQPYDAAFPRSLGIEPANHRLIAIKSIVHFRNTYESIAERIFDMDTQGGCRPDFACYPYRHLRRPVYPLDQAATF